MPLDIQTILVALLTHLVATALALPVIMAGRISRAARCFQAAVGVQALGWAAFLMATRINDRLLSTLSIACLSASFVLLGAALQGWMGPRPARRALWVLAALTPLGYGALFGSYPWRVGWSNFGLALQMVVLCAMLAAPAEDAHPRWRGLVGLCLAVLALVTAWRGVLGAFFTEAYPFYRATHPVNVAAALMYHVALALTTLGLLVAWREEAERELRRQAQTDGLTGLLNRPAFAERAAGLLAHARRYAEPVSLVMIDIDHFKAINDTHGHAAGDRALESMADMLRTCARKGDLIGRHGGEEFCVLMAHADAADAVRFDERLRARLKAGGEGPALDFSAGSASMAGRDATLDALLRQADGALYRAKAQGRARLVQEARDPAPPVSLQRA